MRASIAFGVRIGSTSNSASTTGRAGAGLRTMRHPRAAARLAAATTASSSASNPSRHTASAGTSSESSADRTESASRWPFAPRATAIWFSPAASTTISAIPVWTPGTSRQAEDIHAIGCHTRQCRSSKVVVADRTDHGDRRAGTGGRNGLVAALAAVLLHEAVASHGLPRRRQRRHDSDEVHVDGADHDDATTGVVRGHVPRVPGEPPRRAGALTEDGR